MDRSNGQARQETSENYCSTKKNDNSRRNNRPLLFVLALVFCLTLAYIVNFHSHPISGDPGDWGALGDYLGGIANPLISTIALIYLVKAYYTQKTELTETRRALKDAAKHSEDSARAQAKLVEAAIKQEAITKQNLELKLLITLIDLHQSRITFLQKELSNSTFNYNQFKSTIDIFSTTKGSWLSSRDEMDSYRYKILSMINKEDTELTTLTIKVKEALNPTTAPEQIK